MPTGTYDVTITAPGFQTFKQNAIHLDPGDQKSVRDVHLTPGAKETIDVTSGADVISLDSGEQSSLISAQAIQHLSVEGRDVTELFKILPGFANALTGTDNRAYDPSQVTAGGALGSYAANGTPLNGVSELSDGADITDPGAFGSSMQTVNYEQVAEVKVQTSSFTADGARGPIVVNAVGKSGGSTYHGSLYTYARTSQLNSTDWIANHTGQMKPPDRQVYPGATFGGPLRIPGLGFNSSKKLTFFVGAEEYAQRNAYAYGKASNAVLTALVPTAGMRTGDYSATQLQSYLGSGYTPSTTGCAGTLANLCTVPTTGPAGQALTNGNISAFLDPLAAIELNELPLPNAAANGTYNYITTNLVDNNLYQAKMRVDDAISEKQKLFAVYSVQRGSNGVPQSLYYSPRGVMGGVNVPGGGLVLTTNSQIASLNLTSVITSTLTNEFYASGAYFKQNFLPKSLTATEGNPYAGLFNNGSTVLPQLTDYGYDGLPLNLIPDGSDGGIYAQKVIKTFGDNLTKVIGPHTFRTGIFYQLDINHQVQSAATNGALFQYYEPETYTDPVAGLTHNTGVVGSGSGGNYLADFAEGHVFGYSQTNIQPAPNLYFFNLAGYLQDHWRISSKLTLDAGIRFEHSTPWADSHGQGIPVFSPTAYAAGTNPLLPGFLWHGIDPNTPNAGLLTRWAYIEPRAGFSWDVYGQGKTVVRGGYGIYRAHDSSNNAAQGVSNVLGQRTANLTGPINISSIASQAKNYANAATTFTPDLDAYGYLQGDDEEPQIQTYNISVDQRLPAGFLFELAYVGNYSNHILDFNYTPNTNISNVNSLPVGALFGPQPNSRPDLVANGTLVPGTVYPTFVPTGSTALPVTGLSQGIIDSFKKYPLYNHIFATSHHLDANYNGLQAVVVKQSAKSTVSFNYTFSKSLGTLGAFNNGGSSDPFNLANDYAEEAYDHRSIFNAAYSYYPGDLVKSRLLGLAANGWELSGISNYQSGGPITATVTTTNFNLAGNVIVPYGSSPGSGRGTCTVAAGCTLSVSNTAILGTPDVTLQPLVTGLPSATTGSHQYVNGAVFALPNYGTNGAYRFGFLPGPAFFNTDLTAAKRFKVNEKSSFQLRVAAFNFINHANTSFSQTDPNAYTLNFNSGTTGGATGVNGALNSVRNVNTNLGYAPLRAGRRIMEVALRYDF